MIDPNGQAAREHDKDIERDADLEPGFKMTALGPLPKDWDAVKLEHVIEQISSGDWGKESPDEGLLRFFILRGTDFVRAQHDIIEGVPMRYIRESRVTKLRLRPSDVLVEISGGSKAQPTGRILLVSEYLVDQTSGNVTFSNFVKRLLIKAMVLPGYFRWYWEHLYQIGRTRIYEKRTTGIRNFKLNDFLSSEHIALPTLDEQARITHALDTVQRGIEETGKVVDAARELKKSLMRHLFTYGPVPVGQVDGVRLKETEIGPVPEHWVVSLIGDVIKQVQYGLSKRSQEKGAYPILGMNNLSEGRVKVNSLKYIDLSGTEFQKFRLNKGDLLFNRTNSYELVGKTSLFDLEGDFAFASYLVRVEVDSEFLTPEFLNYYLNDNFVQARLKLLATRGVSQSNISATKLKGFAVPIPPPPEQQEIVRILQAVDKKIEAEENYKRALEVQFKTLLHYLMTGKIRVETAMEKQ